MQALGAGYGGSLAPAMYHNRSVSLSPPQTLPTRGSVSKAKSTTALRSVALANAAELESSFQTLQDPRTASTSDLSRRGSGASKQETADMEMAALSDKLISAINHQQTLDDSLAETRHELEIARKRIAELEGKEKNFEATRRTMVRKESADRLNEKLNAELEEAKKERSLAQQDKRGMEQEVEALTAQLFEQANKMVAEANKERDAIEKKNQQLREQIKDGEALIASQGEQLMELKSIMQQIQTDHRKELTDSPRVSLGPGSPTVPEDQDANLNRLLEAMDLERVSAEHGIVPSPATKFTHLIRQQCRTDVPAFDDFKNLIQLGSARSHNPSHAPSRAGSGSYGGLNVMGISSLYSGNNSSSPNLGSAAKVDRSPGVPGSFSPNADTKGPTPLKDTRFFKRIMTEDIEPTLRIDLSPTISWLNRRALLTAIADNALMVEPIPEASLKLYGKYTSCSLCGESRKELQNPRTHAMRVREGDNAPKWPICVLCLEKVRAVGDLVSYTRMIRDGVVKCGDQKEEEEAWEELVRLRERLFWSRMAGGVVPAFIPSNKNSPTDDGPSKPSLPEGESSKSPGFATPEQSPRNSQDGDAEADDDEKAAQLQLQAGLDGTLTTFENAKEHAKKRSSQQNALHSTPPNTPPRNRESGGFPKINIPRLPQGFWEGQVNTLH